MSLNALLRAVGFNPDSADPKSDAVLGSDFARLEDRIVYSSSPIGDVGDADPESIEVDGVNVVDEFGDDSDIVAPASAYDPGDLNIGLTGQSTNEVVLVDAGTDGYEQLLDDLLASRPNKSIDVLLIDSSVDGIEQITQALQMFGDLDAIHIVSHGSDGQIQIGDTLLDLNSLASHAGDVASWGNSLASDGDILFYGCNLAESEAGMELAESISELTQADVAASDDVTGHVSLGGDWEFEFFVGDVAAEAIFSSEVQANWLGALDTITVSTTDDVLDGNTTSLSALAGDPGPDGEVSLREAIVAANQAADNDVIYVGSGNYALTILGDDEFAVPDASVGDLDILFETRVRGAGAGNTSISGGSIGERIFHLHAGDEFRVEDVTLMQGTNLGGAILTEVGTELDLRDSTLQNNNQSGGSPGGALAIRGTADISDVILLSNGQTNVVAGGAIWTDVAADVSLDNVKIESNQAASGAGIFNQGDLTVIDSWIHGNQADNGIGLGGGIWNDATSGSLVVQNSTIVNNSAFNGGGVFLDSDADLTNVTFSSNTAFNEGGAINNQSNLSLMNNTLAFNQANGGTADGIANSVGGVVTIQNTILDNGGNNYVGPNPVTSNGGNLSTDVVNGFGGLDQQSVNPTLSSLTDNGGPTPTHGIPSSSFAVDTGVALGAPMTDQRGFARAGTPDAGAFEATIGVSPVAQNDAYVTMENGVLTSANGVLDNDLLVAPNIVTQNLSLEYVAGLDTDGNNVWEDETGVVGFDFSMQSPPSPTSNAPKGINDAYNFDASVAAIHSRSLDNLPNDPSDDPASFEFWIRPRDNSVVGREVLFDAGWSALGSSFVLNGADYGGQVMLEFTSGASSNGYVLTAADVTTEVDSGSYIHVVGTIDTTVGATVLYVNSIAADSAAAPSLTDWSTDQGGFSHTGLGGPSHQATSNQVASVHSGFSAFDGEIAIHRFYESALSSSDVLQNYQAMSDLSLSAPIPQVATSIDGIVVSIATNGTFTYDPSGVYEYLQVGETVIDSFDYEVTTSAGDTDSATAYVEVSGMNDDPQLVTNAGITVAAGGNTTITTNELETWDVDNSDAELTYTLMVAPIDGILELNGSQLFAGQTFTQADISTLALEYVHGGSGVAPDVFEFSVADANGGSIVATTFGIAVTSVGQISGFVYEDVNGDSVLDDGNLGTPVAVEGVDVYLYRDDDGFAGMSADDSYIGNTQTSASGGYIFDIGLSDDYFVAVDSTTVKPSAGYTDPLQHSISDVWAVQTYGTEGAMAADGSGGTEMRTAPGFAGAIFGGRQAGVSDNASVGLMESQHVTAVTVTSGSVSDVNFGFSFNVVTNLSGGDAVDHDPEDRTMQGTLRQFIQNANAIAGPNAMRFVPVVAQNASQGADAWWKSDVTVLLPTIEGDFTAIDGRAYEFKDEVGISGGQTFRDSNSAVVGSTDSVGLGAASLAGVHGSEFELTAQLSSNLDYGLLVTGDDVTIEHMAINNFGDGVGVFQGANIQIGSALSNPARTHVEHTVLGADAAASAAELDLTSPGGGHHGILIWNASDGLFENNVVVRASASGVKLTNSQGWTINNNEIRGNALLLGNQDGIDIATGSGGALVVNNLVTTNAGAGVDTYESTGLNYIQDNTISDNGGGGLEGAGVRLFGDSNTVIQNLITNNAMDGVLVMGNQTAAQTPSAENRITQNSFVGNGERAIDLGSQFTDINRGDGVNPTDGSYDALAGNIGIEQPILDSIIFDGTLLNIIFTPQLNTHDVEIYVAAPADPSDLHFGDYYGEGQHFVATAVPTLSSPTGYVIGGTPSHPIGANDRLTLLAIDANGNTSEFSNVLDVEYAPSAIDDAYTVSENGSLSADASLNDADEDGQDLSYAMTSTPPGTVGAFTLNPDGTFDYVAAPSYSGTFTVPYRATDTTGLFDDASIAITVTNDNAEESLSVNAPLLVPEGDSGTITRAYLETTDTDDPSADIQYTVTLQPIEGDLLLNGSILGTGNTFTQADINAGNVTYIHGSSDAPGDNFWFTVDDGQGTATNGIFSIIVENREESLVVNQPLTVFKGNSGTITNVLLQTTDLDDSTDQLTYTIGALPLDGNLLLNGISLAVGETFSQTDIDANLLTYAHDPAVLSDAPSDNFQFSVDDGQGSATNSLFNITIENSEESLIVNQPLTVFKGQAGTIDTSLLQTTDVDDSTIELIYSIGVLPADGDLLLGGVPLSVGGTFTQADIDGDFLSYAHDPVTLGDAPSDSFSFSVNDGLGTATNGQFNILVENREQSLDVNQPLDVLEGASINISTASLQTNDADDSPIELIYSILQPPLAGELRLSGVALGTNDTFTQADIDGGLLFYLHDSSDSLGDTFRFEVDDGRGTVSSGLFTFIVTNREEILFTNSPISVLEGAVVTIGNTNLLTSDEDDDASQLIYEINDSTDNGVLSLNGVSMSVGSTFTQEDINNGRVAYAHDGNETSSDQFSFTVNDGQGTSSSGSFDIGVLPSNDSPTLNIPGLQQVVEESPLAFSSATGNGITVGDPDAAAQAIRLTIAPDNGTVSLPAPILSTLTFVTGDGAGDSLMVVEGTVADLNAALDGLVFIPNVGYVGVTPLTIIVNDLGNTGSPGPLAVNDSISIEVQDTPTATDDSYQTLGGQAITVSSANSLLANDTVWPEVTGPNLISSPSNGTLLWNGDGTFTYSPRGAFVGTDSFVYQLVNGLAVDTATVTITVLPAPVPDPDQPPGSTEPSPDKSVEEDAFNITPGVGIPLPGQPDSEDNNEPLNRSSNSETQEELVQEQTGGDAEASTASALLADSRRIAGRYGSDIDGFVVDFETGAFGVASDIAVDTFDTSSLFGTLDNLEDSMLGLTDVSGWRAQSGLALTSGLSIGWVLWSLKGGYIVGSLLSTASPWTLIDPLPVLDTIDAKPNKKKQKDQEPDKLERMID